MPEAIPAISPPPPAPKVEKSTEKQPQPAESEIPKLIVNTPGMMSAEKIREAIKKEQESRKAAEQEISDDAIAAIFKSYAEKHSSKSTRNALLNTLIKLEGKVIKVAVPTLFIKEQVLQETELIAEIRTLFHAEDLVLQADVKKELFPEYEELSAMKVRLTSREIYEKMAAKNPALKDLINTLRLKPEGE